jgi:hypothetical protein
MATGWYYYDTNGNRRKVVTPYFYDTNGNRRKITAGYFYDTSGNRRLFFSGAPTSPNFQLTAGAANSNRIGFTDGGTSGVISPTNPLVPGGFVGSLFNCWTPTGNSGFTLGYSISGAFPPQSAFGTLQIWNAAGNSLLWSLTSASAAYTAQFSFATWNWAASPFKLVTGTTYQIRFI